ncbi:hypothetical protein HELRODRAFT_175190 [Helobdella robusta]|uniref:THAP-type domain-containing protein n=1 Tax=Helobdella robusta TaxID=6412 RepID=T1F8Z4_HELRO|nr:hypothetical protein HELRODRAFT_175190 [Helobdella robusta]ESO01161.1 hypothetical protein HELRODRAFT_175190 [Helobdella robusta]
MPMCSISKCHGSYKDIGVTLHRLPKDDSQRIQWEGNIKNHITNFCSRKNIFICSRHFLQECFYKILSNDQADTLSEMQSPIMMEKKSTDEPIENVASLENVAVLKSFNKNYTFNPIFSKASSAFNTRTCCVVADMLLNKK